jgi:hypothetical protein
MRPQGGLLVFDIVSPPDGPLASRGPRPPGGRLVFEILRPPCGPLATAFADTFAALPLPIQIKAFSASYNSCSIDLEMLESYNGLNYFFSISAWRRLFRNFDSLSRNN